MNAKSRWKSKLLAGTLSIAALTFFTDPAFSQIGIVIGRTPPPMRYERRPPPPGEGFVWVDGYWGANGGRYVWVPGRWERPPYAGAYWSHPHYDRYREGWRYHEGHWDRDDHGDHYRDRDGDRDHDRDRDRH